MDRRFVRGLVNRSLEITSDYNCPDWDRVMELPRFVNSHWSPPLALHSIQVQIRHRLRKTPDSHPRKLFTSLCAVGALAINSPVSSTAFRRSVDSPKLVAIVAHLLTGRSPGIQVEMCALALTKKIATRGSMPAPHFSALYNKMVREGRRVPEVSVTNFNDVKYDAALGGSKVSRSETGGHGHLPSTKNCLSTGLLPLAGPGMTSSALANPLDEDSTHATVSDLHAIVRILSEEMRAARARGEAPMDILGRGAHERLFSHMKQAENDVREYGPHGWERRDALRRAKRIHEVFNTNEWPEGDNPTALARYSGSQEKQASQSRKCSTPPLSTAPHPPGSRVTTYVVSGNLPPKQDRQEMVPRVTTSECDTTQTPHEAATLPPPFPAQTSQPVRAAGTITNSLISFDDALPSEPFGSSMPFDSPSQGMFVTQVVKEGDAGHLLIPGGDTADKEPLSALAASNPVSALLICFD